MTYLPLMGLSVTDFFKYWDILVFVEAVIYTLDEINEKIAGLISGNFAKANEYASDLAKGERILMNVLEKQGLWTGKIHAQWLQGMQFWHLEREICAALHGNSEKNKQDSSILLQKIHLASGSKSFDYRMLTLILYALLKQQPDIDLINFLYVDEELIDLGDDLFDYEDDVINNSFNILRGYIYIYGDKASEMLVARISALEKSHSSLLQKLPKEVQERYQRRQRTAGSEEGSLSWRFPQLIADERAYRQRVLEAGSQ